MAVTAWLPTVPPRPAPEIMTPDEAVVYLRLDEGSEGGVLSLDRYRRAGRLVGVKIGKAIRYRRVDLDRFVEELANG